MKRLQPLVVPLHLPGIFFSGKAEVERGLRVKKVGHVAPVALAVSAYQRIGRDGKDVVRPDIIVAVSVLLLLLAFLKPFVLARRVPCHEIQEDLHAERFCARKKAPEIVHRAEPFVDGVIVGYVVPAVPEGRTIDGIDPHEICKLPDVFQLFRDAVQVADPVSVGIVEGGGINGVDDRTFNGWIFHRPVFTRCSPSARCTNSWAASRPCVRTARRLPFRSSRAANTGRAFPAPRRRSPPFYPCGNT